MLFCVFQVKDEGLIDEEEEEEEDQSDEDILGTVATYSSYMGHLFLFRQL